MKSSHKSFGVNEFSANILIVDDEPANLVILEQILKNEGYTSIVCESDSRNVQSLYESQPFDLVLLDIKMPHMDGFEVIDRLNQIDSSDYVPVLVITALADRETRLKALEIGAKDFVTKPFDRLEILNRIRNMLQVRLLHKQALDYNLTLEKAVWERTQELQKKSEELKETQLEIIRRLGRAAEYRDNETGLHIIRMSKYSQLLAFEMGLGADKAELLLNASPMHDVGKIGIPDSILLKPGRLDSDEWEIMKTHTTIGGSILSGHDSDLIKTAKEIALTHHEKWDGSGYPNGLKGENIPIFGRIVSLADVFDALISPRPYKDAWSVKDAVDLINVSSSTHFGPDLGKVFKKVLPGLLDIYQTYREPS